MFGYVKPFSPELKVRENEYYKAVYCGLCRAMGRKTGCASRLALSYDFVFLALIRMALCESARNIGVRSGRCLVHPLKKRPYLEGNDSILYCAQACALLTYGKIADDVSDSRGLKKFGAKALLPFAQSMKKRAENLRGLNETISSHLQSLGKIEEEKRRSADEPANEFGSLLAEVFAFGIGDEKKRRIARQIGYHTGKWIYVTDAADDYESDLKSGAYNPLVYLYGFDEGGETRLAPELMLTHISEASSLELIRLERAVNLIDFSDCPDLKGIICNIIYLGMPAVTDRIAGSGKSGGKNPQKKGVD